ncbi:MAG: hypothetical protein LBC18_11345 [Opitutaceae bacterium]|jgi:hypothetical protein|nr:hypothetical protein [Opitutaceae bacterium]
MTSRAFHFAIRPLRPLRPLLFALCAFLPPARAANVYWTAATGAWFTPGAWRAASPAGAARNAPAATDNAIVASGSLDIGAGVSATNAIAAIGSGAGLRGAGVPPISAKIL